MARIFLVFERLDPGVFTALQQNSTMGTTERVGVSKQFKRSYE